MVAQLIVVAPEPTEVDDPPYPCRSGVAAEVLGVDLLTGGPVIALADRVDQVDRNIDIGHRLGQIPAGIARHDLDVACPPRCGELGRRPRQAAHLPPCSHQWRDESPADVAG